MKTSHSLILCACLAYLTCFVSENLHPRFEHRDEVISKEFHILKGEPYTFDGREAYFPEFQNRVLFALILSGASNLTFLSTGEWYLIVRYLFALAAFFCFWFLLRSTDLTTPQQLLGLGLLAYSLIFAFNHGFEQPSDFTDVFFVSLFIWAAIKDKKLWVILITILACFGRESAVFAGVIWFFVRGFKERLITKEISFAAMLSVGAYLLVLAIRYGFGGSKAIGHMQTLGITTLWGQLRPALTHPTPYVWPIMLIVMLSPPSFIIWLNRKNLSTEHKRLLLASLSIFCLTIALALIQELRTVIPAAIVLLYVASSTTGEESPSTSLKSGRI